MITKPIIKLIFIVSILSLIVSCEHNQDYKSDSEYIARIAGFDLNCSTCFLQFPDATSQIKREIGESPDNIYQTTNLNKGNYEPGQKVRVKLRNAQTNELNACITLYPSFSYKNVFITEIEDFNNLIFNDTIELSYQDCLYDPESRFYLCLDSVLNDSRCPTGALCFWEGNAEVKLRYEKLNENPIYFNLNTHSRFTTETIIDKYKFTLVGLNPYPIIGVKHPQNLYKAKLIVKKN